MNSALLLTSTFLLAATISARANDLARDKIASAAELIDPQVVQLVYFGESPEMLGAPAAPVSGLLLNNGWVLTSLYGLQDAPVAILCRTHDGDEQSAELIARDYSRRIALLRLLDQAAVTPPTVEGSPARVGETTLALGRVYQVEQTNLAVGVVSAVRRFGGRALQTDAAISPANYGGPLIGIGGELLGLIAPLAPAGQNAVELYDSGIGFAITPDQLQQSLERLALGEDIHPGWLGVQFEATNPLRFPAKVVEVAADSPAAEAGLQRDDVLLRLAGQRMPTLWKLRSVLSGLTAGETVMITVRSKDVETEREITLRKAPPKQKKPAGDISPDGP